MSCVGCDGGWEGGIAHHEVVLAGLGEEPLGEVLGKITVDCDGAVDALRVEMVSDRKALAVDGDIWADNSLLVS